MGVFSLLSAIALLIITFSSFSSAADPDAHWGYYGNYGPDHWPLIYKRYCSGRRQSPIKLKASYSSHDPTLKHYIFTKPANMSKYKIYNDGHKVSVHFNEVPFVTSVYNHPDICLRPNHVHWHWGSKNSIGSEHWVEEKQYAMEGHFVHWDCHFYKNVSHALGGIDGLAVLGVFYEVDSSVSPNKALQEVIDTFTLANVRQCNACYADSTKYSTHYVNGFDFTKLLPENTKDYWTYYGSLTTPDCRENVAWTVFRQTIKIPPSQMEAFRSLRYPAVKGVSDPMVDNFRGPKELNPVNPPGPKRLLTRSFKLPSDDSMDKPKENPATEAPQKTEKETGGDNAVTPSNMVSLDNKALLIGLVFTVCFVIFMVGIVILCRFAVQRRHDIQQKGYRRDLELASGNPNPAYTNTM